MGRSPADGSRRLRCAIYTRKSSEEGLEQDFNSLDAQREACEAFIQSQKHEGWQCLPAGYDDGGISGATMERPALQRLLCDIQAGTVEVAVVYKVDRLTRSLADFAKMVEIFDAKGVSFVSVTQQFNTTTSIGRLTLNVLLSFAQFEREVTGERIRDKIAASKKKGLWMGGNPPLGYDVKDRSLVVNEIEADTVRFIFRRYAELGSVRELKMDLDARGIIGKVRQSASGRPFGGKPFSRGALYKMLQNGIYRGEIVHHGRAYPGKHAAIVDLELWATVAAALAKNRMEHSTGQRSRHPSLLTGLLYDAAGNRLSPTHAVKEGNRRYRYYVSQSLTTDIRTRHKSGLRLPATELERAVCSRLHRFLSDPVALFEAIAPAVSDAPEQQSLLGSASRFAQDWETFPTSRQRHLLRVLICCVRVHQDRLELQLSPTGLIAMLRNDETGPEPVSNSPDEAPLTLTVETRLYYSRTGLRMVVQGGHVKAPKPDPSLVRLIVTAHALKEKWVASQGRTIEELAKAEGLTASWFTRVLRLAFLAPDITEAILQGRQPEDLTASKLQQSSRLPYRWDEQRRQLGFPAR